MIAARVERLHHHHQPGLLANLGATAEHIDHAGRLVFPIQALVVAAGHDRTPFGVDALGDLHRVADVFEDRVARLGFPGGDGEGRIGKVLRGHEDAHRHFQIGQRLADLLLIGDGTVGQAVVFERGEALLTKELQLGDQVVARVQFEHAEMRRVVEFEFVCGFGAARAGERHIRRGHGRYAGDQPRGDKIPAIHRALPFGLDNLFQNLSDGIADFWPITAKTRISI